MKRTKEEKLLLAFKIIICFILIYFMFSMIGDFKKIHELKDKIKKQEEEYNQMLEAEIIKPEK